MKKKITTFEFITAFVVMSIFIYIFIRKGHREIAQKVTEMDSSVNVTNKNIVNLSDSIYNLNSSVITIMDNIHNLYFRESDILDMTINNSNIHRATNQMLEKNFDYLSIINQKQDMILKELKSQKKVDTIFVEKLVDKE